MAESRKRKGTSNGKEEGANKFTRITGSMNVNAPRQAVFQTVELLENIFLSLPPPDTFVAQKDLICQLPSAGSTFTPYFVKKSSDGANTRGPGTEKMLKAITPFALNPVLLLPCSKGGASAAMRVYHNYNSELLGFALPLRITAPGSWRNMQITDPPCREATLDLEFEKKSQPSVRGRSYSSVRNDYGITLGNLIDGVLHKTYSLLCGSLQLKISGRRCQPEKGKSLSERLKELVQPTMKQP
ncbi:hypothetical protein EJ03DRAFT_333872 [Teratosphaeria nubilosa]|uniref:Uncharacterized protein n=1 Tax=Teratosphaeria nubilosa TaxID=161662 RepID=A0A6G1LJM6_9PEZI|nr:hypothetical protein EJ03DRAFT_333872 [Teratosphaeria nubilosa]